MPQSVMDTARLDAALRRFREHPIIDELRRFIIEAPDEALFHIDVDGLARTWNVTRRTVLEVFLRAVRFGILRMEWIFHCPTCGGVAKESLSLTHTHEQVYVDRVMADVADGGTHQWREGSTVHGVEVINHPVFREIFGEETLSLDQSLEIASATVLFTDVTGSTALYEELGDARPRREARPAGARLPRLTHHNPAQGNQRSRGSV